MRGRGRKDHRALCVQPLFSGFGVRRELPPSPVEVAGSPWAPARGPPSTGPAGHGPPQPKRTPNKGRFAHAQTVGPGTQSAVRGRDGNKTGT